VVVPVDVEPPERLTPRFELRGAGCVVVVDGETPGAGVTGDVGGTTPGVDTTGVVAFPGSEADEPGDDVPAPCDPPD